MGAPSARHQAAQALARTVPGRCGVPGKGPAATMVRILINSYLVFSTTARKRRSGVNASGDVSRRDPRGTLVMPVRRCVDGRGHARARCFRAAACVFARARLSALCQRHFVITLGR
jgi:hypothetical protein